MNSESSQNGFLPPWRVFKVSLLATLLSCGYAWGEIGETQQEMIQRLGEPETKTETSYHFTLKDLSLSARFKGGICVEEDYDITRIKAQNRERIQRIELLLSEASGGKSWDIVNLSGEEVKWETKDGTLNAILYSQEESGGSRDDPDSWTAEYLTVTSVAFQVEEDERSKKLLEAEERDYPNPLLRIVILGVLGWLAVVFWREKRLMLSVIFWAFIIAANPFVPLPKVPIFFGGILILGCVAFGGMAALGYWVVKREK